MTGDTKLEYMYLNVLKFCPSLTDRKFYCHIIFLLIPIKNNDISFYLYNLFLKLFYHNTIKTLIKLFIMDYLYHGSYD